MRMAGVANRKILSQGQGNRVGGTGRSCRGDRKFLGPRNHQEPPGTTAGRTSPDRTTSPGPVDRFARWSTEVSYATAHVRVRDARGRACDHECIDCGRQAEQWSYRGDSAHELQGWNQTRAPHSWMTYGPHPGDYDPRCRTCHGAFDSNRRAQARVAERRAEAAA